MTNSEWPGRLEWAIRGSLFRYVTVICHGTVTVDGGATVDDAGVFTFPLRTVVRVGEDAALSFGGSVRLQAHAGLLDVVLIDPELLIGPAGGILIARTASDTVTPLAATPPVEDDAGEFDWPAVPAQLLESAVKLFGGVYPAGTELAPLAVAAVSPVPR